MKFKIGDKVVVKKHLKVSPEAGVVPEMSNMAGEVLTIKGIDSFGNYEVYENYFAWGDNEFEENTFKEEIISEFTTSVTIPLKEYRELLKIKTIFEIEEEAKSEWSE